MLRIPEILCFVLMFSVSSFGSELDEQSEDWKKQLDTILEQIVQKPELAKDQCTEILGKLKKEDRKRSLIQAYYTLGRANWQLREVDNALANLDSALILSDEFNEHVYKNKIWYYKGVITYYYGKKSDAITAYEHSIQFARIVEDYRQIGSSHSMLGTLYRVIGMYEKSIEHTLKSKIYYEKADYNEGVAWVNYLMGRIFYDMSLPDRAIAYFEDSRVIYEDLAAQDDNYGGVALCLEQMGLINLERKNYTPAIRSFERVLEIQTDLNSQAGVSNAYKHLGMVYYDLGNYERALEQLNRALWIKLELDETLSLPVIYEYIGLCEYKMGDHQKGIQLLLDALRLAEKNNQRTLQKSICATLYQTYLLEKDFEQAIFFSQKQVAIQDSITVATAKAKEEQLEDFIDVEEKNIQIEELEKDNERQKTTLIFLRIGLVSIFIIIMIVLWFMNKIRLKNTLLAEANATKSKLFSIVSHDLRGPLGAISNLTEILVSEELDPDQSKVYIATIDQQLRDTNRLLHNLLEWSSTQQSGIQFKPVMLDLSECLASISEQLDHQLTNKNIKVLTEGVNGTQIWADKAMLEIMLRNLLSNSIKFSGKGELIHITVTEKNSEWQLSITDRGIGMDQETIKHLFQVDQAKSRPGTQGERGTGIGLLLVQEFIAKHKGRIQIESKEGIGSTFTLIFPKKS